VALRLPTLFNLRTGPFEHAGPAGGIVHDRPAVEKLETALSSGR
jgi:hypothetical protein